MSMYLNFETHSWYMGFAIEKDPLSSPESSWKWTGLTDDGNTYQIIEFNADTLRDLKQQIRDYYRRDNYEHCPARLLSTLTRTSLTDSMES